MNSERLPILVAGAGAMGGAFIAGLRHADAVAAADLLIRDPEPGPAALAARDAGAALNPPDAELARARTVFLAVKPQMWRAVAGEIAPLLDANTAVVSAVAGVSAEHLASAFGGRRVARVMPTLAAAIGQGAIAVWSEDAPLADQCAALMAPLGEVTRLADEDLLHVATAASGSGPAYLYAFLEALEAAAVRGGLPPDAAARMVRATICGAARLLAENGGEPATLKRVVTTPGGTTEAALDVLMSGAGLVPLMSRAVAAATARSRELGR